MGDTGRFQYPNTTEQTLLYAGQLLSYNFSAQDFYKELYKESRSVAKLKGMALTHYELTENGVAYYVVSKETMEQLNVTAHEASNLVNCLSNIEGNHIWLFFIEADYGYRVRIRSKEVAINKVAQKFGGGGHPLASGVKVENQEVGEQLIRALDEKLTNRE
ncbi:DHHA1 domain-containing protein (plasmid) [Rossellomorea sp. AcN35-11]|nr:DHHA1 domain-containing protein [Rossellomorea sp. AcN35-11]